MLGKAFLVAEDFRWNKQTLSKKRLNIKREAVTAGIKPRELERIDSNKYIDYPASVRLKNSASTKV